MAKDTKDTRETRNEHDANPAEGAFTPKNWLMPVLLLVLRDWSSYGYDLMERLATFGFAAMNRSTLYRLLRQMEKDGMVNSAWDTSKAGPARRVYSITEAGEAYLKLWADSLEQYRKMMESFFRLYGVPTPHPAARDAANDKQPQDGAK